VWASHVAEAGLDRFDGDRVGVNLNPAGASADTGASVAVGVGFVNEILVRRGAVG
jgi:hypothetical protein